MDNSEQIKGKINPLDSIVTSEDEKAAEELKAKNKNTFYERIDEWRKYFNPLESQGPQVF